MADTNYTRGEMKIADQKDTYGGFMRMSMYGGAIIIVALLVPILIFAMNVAWPAAMLGSVLLGIIIGIALKFHPRWYVLLVTAAILVSIFILIGTGVAALLA